MLMDCGSRAVTELEKEISPLDLDAVIISHYHPDHVADLGVLRHYFQLYPKHLWEPKILPIYGHTEDEQEFAKLTLDGVSQGKAYDVSACSKFIQAFKIARITSENKCLPCCMFDNTKSVARNRVNGFDKGNVEWTDLLNAVDIIGFPLRNTV